MLQRLVDHLILVDEDGRPLHPADKHDLEPNEYHEYIDNILAQIQTHPPDPGTGKTKILIHIHGGLNRLNTSRSRADSLRDPILNASYYPVFLGWRSGLFSSYGEHLFVVRQGRKQTKLAWSTSPFFLIADLGRGVTRAPISFYRRVASALKTASSKFGIDRQNADAYYNVLRQAYLTHPADAIAVSKGKDTRSTWDKRWRAARYLLTLPTKFLSAVLIDGFGKAAWENMRRRTRVVFRSPDEFNRGRRRTDPAAITQALNAPPTAAFAEFFRRLSGFVNPTGKDPFQTDYEVTLVGHSMGAIILNEVIRVYDTLPYKNIVYMGAACSIREWAALTLPYLTDHTESRFVNLCLHPIAEPREIAAIGGLPIGDLISRGSLLEWIDDMFSSPNDILDRWLGKWDNILQATHIIEDPGVRPRITLKAFDVDSGGQKPQRHGEFNGLEFWDPALWEA